MNLYFEKYSRLFSFQLFFLITLVPGLILAQSAPVPGGYTFNSSSDISAWGINIYSGGLITGSVAFNATPADSCYSGSTGALEVQPPFTAANQVYNVDTGLAGPTNFAGMAITLVADISNGFNSNAPQYYGQIYLQDGAAQGYASVYQSTGTSFLSASGNDSGCVTFTMTVPSSATSGGFDPTQVTQIGFQIGTGSGGTGWSTITVDVQGWVYQSNTPTPTLTPTSTPTAMPTATPAPLLPGSTGYTFNSNADISGWNVNQYSGGLTTGSITYNASPFDSCYGASFGALEIQPPFTAANQVYNVVYYLDGATNFSGMSVTMVAAVSGGFNSDAGQYFGQIYLQDGSAQNYASVYQPSATTSFGSASGNNSGCVTFTMTVPATITNGFDPTQVTQIGFQIGTGSGGTAWNTVTVDVQSWVYQSAKLSKIQSSTVTPSCTPTPSSGPALLTVSGNSLLANGSPVSLKGVDIDSMEWYDGSAYVGEGPPNGVGGSILKTEQEAVTAWGANIMRFPLNQDEWFGCSGAGVAAYQAKVQQIVNYASAHGVYVILDLHWSGTSSTATAPCGAGWGNDINTKQQYMADANAVTFWSSVASTFANNPAVIFDLYNEPYSTSPSGTDDTNAWNVWFNGGQGTTATFSTPGMQALLNAVRGAGANNVCLMGGLAWCSDLTQVANYPVTNSGNGVIYSAHLYGSNDGISSSSWNADVPSSVLASYPVFVGEMGPNASNDTDNATYDTNMIGASGWAVTTTGVVGATAWSMNTDTPPDLLANWNFAPTAWGVAVRNWLIPNSVPTFTPTVYITPTPIPSGSCVYSANFASGSVTDSLGTSFYSYNYGGGTNSTSTGVVSPVAGGPAYALQLYGTNLSSGGFGEEATFASAQNFSSLSSINFYFMASAQTTVLVEFANPIIDSANGDYADYSYAINVAASNTWQLVSIPYSALVRQYNNWPTGSADAIPTEAQALAQCSGLKFQTDGANSSPMTFWVGQVCLTENAGTGGSPTSTPTITPTNTRIPSGGYTFSSSSSVSPWSVNIYSGGLTTGSVAYNASPANSCFGGSTGALEIMPPFTAASQNYNVDTGLAGPTNFAGMAVTMIADISNGFDSNAPQYWGQIYLQDGSAQGYAGVYGTQASFGSASGNNSGCVTFTLNVPLTAVSGGFDPTQVTQIGFQIGTGASGTGWSTITVDVQDWSYVLPPTATPTATPTITRIASSSYTFSSSSSVAPWSINQYSGGLTTGSVGYNASPADSCFGGSTGALEIMPPFTAVNQNYNVGAGLAPTNFSGMAITMVADISNGFDSNAPQYWGQIYLQDGSAQGYAGVYGTQASFGSVSGNNSGCVTFTLNVPLTAVSGGFNPTQVTQIGFQIGTGASGTGWSTITVDVQDWSYALMSKVLSTATPTSTPSSTSSNTPTSTATATPTLTPTATFIALACNQTQTLAAGSPYGLALDAVGNVYVADNNNNQIDIFSRNGTTLPPWSGTGSYAFGQPNGLAIAGNNIYVVDFYDNEVDEFTLNGTPVTQWGGSGAGNGQFDQPWGIGTNSAGTTVYVADFGNDRVESFKSTGQYINQWGSAGISGSTPFQTPTGIAVDAAGNVYVTDYEAQTVEVFDYQGNLLRQWSTQAALQGADFIAVDNVTGLVYVSDGDSLVAVYTEQGVLQGVTSGAGSGFQNPEGLTANNGIWYVAEQGANQVDQFAPCSAGGLPIGSPTLAPTGTFTNTATSTPTLTSTATATNTATVTPTLTVTNTLTNTATSTATNSSTSTSTNSPTMTPTVTCTATPTNTASNTATGTATNTATNSPTNSGTATATTTPTSTPTLTVTRTATNTITETATHTARNTHTETPTKTPTETATNTATHTPTRTVTETATRTATQTPTRTATETATRTPSSTPTRTPTATATATRIRGFANAAFVGGAPPSGGSDQFTPTSTATATPTATPIAYAVTLAPVPAASGQPICVYANGSIQSARLQVFNIMGERIADISFTGAGSNCWNTQGTAPGLYIAEVSLTYADGQTSSTMQKILITR